MSQTDAQKRTSHTYNKCADCGLFALQPWILILLPNVLRTTHSDHEIERREIGDGLTLVEFDGVPIQSVLEKEVTKDAGMLDR